MINQKAGIERYSMLTLIKLSLDRKNNNECLSFIQEIINIKKYLSGSGEPYDN